MHRQAESLREQRVVSVIAIAAAASLVVSIADIGTWGALVIFALYAGAQILAPFMSEILNNRAPEEERATVLSVASFLRTLPYVALAPLIGYLNTQGKLEYFLIAWPVLIIAAVLTYFVLKPRDVFDRMGE
jgi:MFS family permease